MRSSGAWGIPWRILHRGMATLKVCRSMRAKPSTWRNRLIRLLEGKENGGGLEKTLFAVPDGGSGSDVIDVASLLRRH